MTAILQTVFPDMAAIGPLLAGIPEAVGLLAAGIGLAAVAVILRWVLTKAEREHKDNTLTGK